jgi:hypothetical protein
LLKVKVSLFWITNINKYPIESNFFKKSSHYCLKIITFAPAMKWLLALFLSVIFSNSFAQCAMCKAQIESSNGEVGNGINAGILFLMIIPYALLITIFIVFFNGKIRTSILKFINS